MTNEYTKEIDRFFETYGPDKKTILLFNGKRKVFTWDYYYFKGTEASKLWDAIDPDDASLSIQFSSDKESLDDMVYDRISGIFDLDAERAKCANNESLWLYVTRDYQVYSCVTSTPSITKSEKLLLDLSSYPDQ
jgi:hypothetical protein